MLLRTCLLKNVTEEMVQAKIRVTGDEEEDVGSYWMTLRKREGTEK